MRLYKIRDKKIDYTNYFTKENDCLYYGIVKFYKTIYYRNNERLIVKKMKDTMLNRYFL